MICSQCPSDPLHRHSHDGSSFSHCLMLLERNRSVFQGVSHSIPWLERRLLGTLYSWVTGLVDPDVLAFVDFLEDLIS